jgi:hypothetical protein
MGPIGGKQCRVAVAPKHERAAPVAHCVKRLQPQDAISPLEGRSATCHPN